MAGLKLAFLLSVILLVKADDSFFRKLTTTPKVWSNYNEFATACTPTTPTPSETECKGRGVISGFQCCHALMGTTNTCVVLTDADASKSTYKCPGAYVDPTEENRKKCTAITAPKTDSECTSIKATGFKCCRTGYTSGSTKIDICQFNTDEIASVIDDVIAKKPLASTATETFKAAYTSVETSFKTSNIVDAFQKCSSAFLKLAGLMILSLAALF
jgi:hypothetical protein